MRAAPLTRSQILLGKLLPCFVLSMCQAFFLLGAGKLIFGMKWGPEQWPVAKQVLLLMVFRPNLKAAEPPAVEPGGGLMARLAGAAWRRVRPSKPDPPKELAV